ncbi:XkdX family protein [Paenibacillus alvei]|uniref:XkdX family protein n=1 Tax=Paenibacillus alvei TaxID=44250 RepID=A0A383RHF3_PAEAL|nr:XkdX family protein [Paenibacillus alvei]SYX86012.1 conserved protein of unknown function [Paenibacillus alvei]
MYKYIKEYFEEGFYKDSDLDVFLQAGWITSEQFAEIIKDNKQKKQ